MPSLGRRLCPIFILSLVPGCFGDDNVNHSATDASFSDGSQGFDATSDSHPAEAGAEGAAEAGTDATGGSDGGADTSSETGGEAGVDATSDSPALADAPADAPESGADAAVTYPSVVEADTPLSYWRFGESTGTVAVDQMGATNGTYMGGVTLGATGAIAGDPDTAATFDGATGWADFGAGFAFGGTASMSFEAWVKPVAADAAARRFISKETNDGAREGFLMAYDSPGVNDAGGATGLLSWERWGSGGTDSTFVVVSVGVYQHVVVTFDGATMSLYLNGVLAGSSPSTRVIETLTDPFRVANYSDSGASNDCFGGTVDEVAVYDHALTPARVAVHYAVGSGGQ